MTIVSTSDFPTDWKQQLYDDLTVIKGIGPARQQWLYEFFHVRTLKDLAALAITDVEAQLKASRQIVSREMIALWTSEAKKLANIDNQTMPFDSEAANKEFSVKVQKQANQQHWQPFASFVVEYQTRRVDNQKEERRTKVHHIETDTCAAWPGIEKKELCHWIIEKLDANAMESDSHPL